MRVGFVPYITNNFLYPSRPIAGQYLRPLEYDKFEKQNINFTASASSKFEIRNIPNMHCPVCGLIMLSDEQIDEFVNDVSNKKGNDLAYALEKYEDDSIFTGEKQYPAKSIYRPQKQQIVDILKPLAIKHPNLDLAQLVQLEAQTRLEGLVSEQMKVITALENSLLRYKLTDEQKEEFANVISKYKAQITNESSEQFSRKKFIHAISEISMKPHTRTKVLKTIEKLPSSDSNIDSFFIKYSKGRNSREIAKKFVFESQPTAEHLIPVHDNGSSSDHNFICDCADCNSRRQHTPFRKWAHTIPNFKENLQLYLEEVQNAINKGIIDKKYSSYIVNIIDKIKDLSSDEIILEMPSEVIYSQEEKITMKRTKQINKIKAQHEEEVRRLEELKSRLSSIEKFANFSIVREYYNTVSEIKKAREQLSRISQSTSNNNKILEAEAKLEKLERRLSSLSEHMDLPQTLQEDLTRTKSLLKTVEDLMGNIQSNNVKLSGEGGMRQRKENLEYENKELHRVNLELESSPSFDTSFLDNYRSYLNLLKVINIGKAMLSRMATAKRSEQTSAEKEIVDAGIKKKEEEMRQLLEMPSVYYFVNKDTIDKNTEEISQIEARLAEMDIVKEEIRALNEKIKGLLGEKTYDELKQECADLEEKLQITNDIRDVNSLRYEIDILQDKVDYNNGVLEGLSNYKDMTNREFANRIAMFY